MAITQRPLALRRDLIGIFGEDRLVAVIRTGSPQIARQAARAMSEAGVRLVEITLTVPDAFEIIEELALDEAFGAHGSIVGAGTVLSGAQAEQALSAGARFLVSAVLVPEMIEAARARDAMSMPGTMTPTEMVQAAELGADFIKVFPVSAIGGGCRSKGFDTAGAAAVPRPARNRARRDGTHAGLAGCGRTMARSFAHRPNAERYLAATRRPATN